MVGKDGEDTYSKGNVEAFQRRDRERGTVKNSGVILGKN